MTIRRGESQQEQTVGPADVEQIWRQDVAQNPKLIAAVKTHPDAAVPLHGGCARRPSGRELDKDLPTDAGVARHEPQIRSGLERKSKASNQIPSSSMADIAFLLLIFFMVTTVFQKDRKRTDRVGRRPRSPRRSTRSRRTFSTSGWRQNGDVYINDALRAMDDVSNVVRPFRIGERESGGLDPCRPERAVSLYVDGLQKELVAAGALAGRVCGRA